MQASNAYERDGGLEILEVKEEQKSVGRGRTVESIVIQSQSCNLCGNPQTPQSYALG